MTVARSITANEFRLGDVADFQHKSSIELLLLNLAQMFHRSTSAAILPNRCCAFVLFLLVYFFTFFSTSRYFFFTPLSSSFSQSCSIFGNSFNYFLFLILEFLLKHKLSPNEQLSHYFQNLKAGF